MTIKYYRDCNTLSRVLVVVDKSKIARYINSGLMFFFIVKLLFDHNILQK